MITDLLATKHANDVFVPECKDGPTWNGPHYRLDAWAMRRSWAKFCTFGYEIKVSRSDFLRDTKMTEYLSLCNEMYVVTPPGICEPNELPEGIGLMITSTNCTRLYTKRKAPHRETGDLWMILAYVLMSRAKIERPYEHDKESSADWWRRWLEDREVNRQLGWRVSKSLREAISAKIEEVGRENDRLTRENERLGEVKSILERYGLNGTSTFNLESKIRDRLEEIERGYSDEVCAALNGAIGSLTTLKSKLDEDVGKEEVVR